MRATTRTGGIGVLGALLALAVVPAIAQNGDAAAGNRPFGPPPLGRGPLGPPAGGGGLAIERLDREIGFTDTQRAAIEALLTDDQNMLRSTVDTLRTAHQALDETVMQIPADDTLLQSRVAAVSTIQAQITLARAQTEAKMYQLLTADQQRKVQEWLAQRQRTWLAR